MLEESRENMGTVSWIPVPPFPDDNFHGRDTKFLDIELSDDVNLKK